METRIINDKGANDDSFGIVSKAEIKNCDFYFDNLNFTKGSNGKKMKIKIICETNIKIKGDPKFIKKEIISVETNPFFILTNEKQYSKYQGKLFKNDTFQENEKISFTFFANKLQIHFLKSIKKDDKSDFRCLSKFDLLYLKKRFFGSL